MARRRRAMPTYDLIVEAYMPNLDNLKKQAKLILRWHRERHYPSRRRRTAADETHMSFYQRWFPQRGRERANTTLAALDPSSWEFRADASFCRPTSGCKHVAGAETDNPYACVDVDTGSTCRQAQGLRL